MNKRFHRGTVHGSLAAGALFTLFALSIPATTLAQQPGPPPGGQGGPGGPGGFGGPGGPGGQRGGQFGMRPSLANMPLGGLVSELKLSDKQRDEIKSIQDQFRKDQRALMPNFQGGPGGGPGGPADPEVVDLAVRADRVATADPVGRVVLAGKVDRVADRADRVDLAVSGQVDPVGRAVRETHKCAH